MQTEIEGRIKKLQQELADKEVDLVILSQNSDLYYYSGSIRPQYLVVPAKGEAFLLARKALAQIESEVGFLKLEPFNGTKDLMEILDRQGLNTATKIAFTLDTITYASVQRLLQLFPQGKAVDFSWEIRALRMVKSEREIAIQAQAGLIMSEIPSLIEKSFQPGMTEIELSVIIESYMRRNGHTGLVRCRREGIEIGLGVCAAGVTALAGTKFDGVCAGSGLNPAVPYGASAKPIERGEPVTLDYAFNYLGYHVDQTRMFSWGQPTAEISRAYEAMYQIQQEVFQNMKPGARWGDLYQLAASRAAELGYEKEFMGLGSEKVRFVGHGIGLELDEPPFISYKMEPLLEEGMVAAVEPKVAFAGVGVVGIEDTVVIKKDGCHRLTTAPTEYIIVD